MVNTDGILIDVNGSFYQGTTNIRVLKDTFFSLRNRKFIRPLLRQGNRVDGYYVYRLFPGNYVTLTYDFWTKQNPSIVFKIELIKLLKDENDNGYNVEKIKFVNIKVNKKSEILNVLNKFGFNKLQDVMNDFLSATPGYHTLPTIDSLTSKIYDDVVVNELLNFINKFDGQILFYQQEID